VRIEPDSPITDDTAGMIPGVPTTILVAPDSFEGAMSATEVAAAIGRGLEDGGHPVDLCPIADGGEGTLDVRLAAVDFDRRMRAARAVVTGEGTLDTQSLAGKVVSEVATRARQAGVPCHAIVGTLELNTFGTRVLDLQAVCTAGTPRQISAAARRLAEVI
jgi:glycerate kinase